MDTVKVSTMYARNTESPTGQILYCINIYLPMSTMRSTSAIGVTIYPLLFADVYSFKYVGDNLTPGLVGSCVTFMRDINFRHDIKKQLSGKGKIIC